VGTRTVRGLEIAGMVALCIAAVPLIVVFFPLMAAGVIQD
jgi:hypothetical protein